MFIISLFLDKLFLITFGLIGILISEETKVLKRIALIVSANDGGGERKKLSFANKDANSFASVFKELGGIENESLIILEQPEPQIVLSKLKEIQNKISVEKVTGNRTELIFYYSGHSEIVARIT